MERDQVNLFGEWQSLPEVRALVIQYRGGSCLSDKERWFLKYLAWGYEVWQAYNMAFLDPTTFGVRSYARAHGRAVILSLLGRFGVGSLDMFGVYGRLL